TFAILDERFLNTPSFAIEQCKSLVNQMGVLARDSFLEAMEVVNSPTEEKIASVIQKEEQVDLYNDKISAYLAQLKSGRISYEDGLKTTFLLHCLTDFERISDHAVNIVECAKKMVKDEAEFSKKAKEEMQIYSDALTDILQRTTESFIEEDVKLARTVEPLEGVIDKLNKEIKKHHMKRLNKGKCTPALGLILSDLAMNYERVADHCSNIAVYMMQLKDNHLEEHSFTEKLDKERAEEFAKMTDLYKEKYII
ncbi:MAG: Na/Pi cotransporter family protein, partial [Lachnospiraceae bacterium]|nr:Na/Pi cotransporter family protein [Lachnospiraceae bacterium]